MRRIRSWLTVLALFGAVLVTQGVMIVQVLPGSGGAGDGQRLWQWSGIVRSEGPIMERIPAPYVVLTVLGGTAVAMIAWSVLVRSTDIDEAI